MVSRKNFHSTRLPGGVLLFDVISWEWSNFPNEFFLFTSHILNSCIQIQNLWTGRNLGELEVSNSLGKAVYSNVWKNGNCSRFFYCKPGVVRHLTLPENANRFLDLHTLTASPLAFRFLISGACSSQEWLNVCTELPIGHAHSACKRFSSQTYFHNEKLETDHSLPCSGHPT